MNWKNGAMFIVCASLLTVALILTNQDKAQGQAPGGKGGMGGMGGAPHYSVVETQGHNLLVTDNAKNMVYFYTTDKDAEIGADLKLRASVDLAQVGGDVIKISKGK